MTKIVKFSEKLEFTKNILDLNNQEIALAYGHFSSIHPGHIRYLQNAKSFGSKLVIALRGDNDKPKSEKYIFSMKERSESLAMLKIADLLVLLDNDELEMLHFLFISISNIDLNLLLRCCSNFAIGATPSKAMITLFIGFIFFM